jgi:signal peptidase I
MIIALLSLVLFKTYNFSFIDVDFVLGLLGLTIILIIYHHVRKYEFDEVMEKGKKGFYTIIDYYSTIVSAFLCIQILFTFVFFPNVNGPSMMPTLYQDNRIVVVSGNRNIERFDVVVFIIDLDKLENVPLSEEGQLWVKRAIGLPGDKIEYRNGFLYVNGEQILEVYLFDDSGNSHNGNYITQLPSDLNGKTVPEDYYLLLGDNRDDSTDSRIIGYVHKSLIVGEGKYIIDSIFNWRKIGE